MSQTHEILRRIANIQQELSALIAALSWPGDAEVSAAIGVPAGAASPAPVPEAPQRKVRWRYVPGTWYRIVGGNPFRNGNNYNLFEFLLKRYGNHPFSREQLGEAITALKRTGRMESVQDEEQIVLVFLRTAGSEKNRIELSSTPNDDEAQPIADVEESLPPEPGEDTYTLLGDMPFRSGVNVAIWEKMGNKPFNRGQLLAVVTDLVNANAFESIRPAETIVRDFLGRVQEKGRLRRG